MIELDKYASLTMTYTEEGYEELKQDIKMKGLLVPIILREGKILDGRHRYKACKELGIVCKYKETGEISDEEALEIIITNAISKDTDTDAAKTEAYLICKAKNLKNKDMPILFKRLNNNYVKKLSFIEKESPKYLQALLQHKAVVLYNKVYEKVEEYGTINGIWKTLKSNKALEDEVVTVDKNKNNDSDYELTVKDCFNNPYAEKEYWDMYHVAKKEGVNVHPQSQLGKKLIELIKNKHNNLKNTV